MWNVTSSLRPSFDMFPRPFPVLWCHPTISQLEQGLDFLEQMLLLLMLSSIIHPRSRWMPFISFFTWLVIMSALHHSPIALVLWVRTATEAKRSSNQRYGPCNADASINIGMSKIAWHVGRQLGETMRHHVLMALDRRRHTLAKCKKNTKKKINREYIIMIW